MGQAVTVIYDGTDFQMLSNLNSNDEFWNTIGNSNTSVTSNFIGTSDNADLLFRVNGIKRMLLKTNGVIYIYGNNSNTNLGDSSAVNNTTGERNTYLGIRTGMQNVGGSDNVLIGYQAGKGNGLGTYNRNVIIGANAGSRIFGFEPTGYGQNNVYIGANVCDLCTSSYDNIMIGTNVAQGNPFFPLGNLIIGNFSSANSHNSILIGHGLSATADGQILFGNGQSELYIGNGVNSSSPTNISINATSGEGFNKNGGNISIVAGKNTGNGIPGQIIFKTSYIEGANSFTQMNSIERMKIDTEGNLIISSLTTSGIVMSDSNGKLFNSTVSSAVSSSGFLVIRNSDQSIISNSTVQVDFNSENNDDGNNFDVSTDKYTAPMTGFYEFTGSVLTLDIGQVDLMLYVNGTKIKQTSNFITLGTSSRSTTQISTKIKLNAGDQVDLRFTQYTGSNQNLKNIDNATIQFSGVRLY